MMEDGGRLENPVKHIAVWIRCHDCRQTVVALTDSSQESITSSVCGASLKCCVLSYRLSIPKGSRSIPSQVLLSWLDYILADPPSCWHVLTVVWLVVVGRDQKFTQSLLLWSAKRYGLWDVGEFGPSSREEVTGYHTYFYHQIKSNPSF
jgi:hypothetical protein